MGKPTHQPYDPEFRARAVELASTSGLPKRECGQRKYLVEEYYARTCVLVQEFHAQNLSPVFPQ